MEQAKLEREERAYFKDKTKSDPGFQKSEPWFSEIPSLEINVLLNIHMPLTKQNSKNKIKQSPVT